MYRYLDSKSKLLNDCLSPQRAPCSVLQPGWIYTLCTEIRTRDRSMVSLIVELHPITIVFHTGTEKEIQLNVNQTALQLFCRTTMEAV